MLQVEPLDYGKTLPWDEQSFGQWLLAGTVIQAPKPVCQFMAEDIPPPVLIQLVIRYLVNLLVRIKEPSSPTGWQQSPQPQTEDTKKSRKLDCVATGFIYNDAVNFTVDICPNYLRTPITLYEEDKKEGASMRCSLLHGSWDQILQRRPSVDKVSRTFWKNCWLNSFHTWHLPLWGESLDLYSFACS